MGEDYATTLCLLPNATHNGSVLALQDLQQEGTEAAGPFFADEENRRQLMKALDVLNANDAQNISFEALIRSRTVSGAPNSTTLVAGAANSITFIGNANSDGVFIFAAEEAPRMSLQKI